MRKRSVVLLAIALLAGLALIYVAGREVSTQLRSRSPSDSAIRQIRLLAARDEPGLADILERSLVDVPAGKFLMGSTGGPVNEGPQRLVYLDAYQIDRYEVTVLQYRRFILATARKAPVYWSGSDYPPGQADVPVVGVSWEDASAYCAWVGKRLPTEAEWEKACRGIDGRSYPWGDQWNPDWANVGKPFEQAQPGVWDAAWSFLLVERPGPAMPSLRPIGTYPLGASPYGVMDLAGNASEWVLDWYNWGDYSNLPARNPQGLGPQWNHCLRGSSWYIPYGDGGEGQAKSRCSARNSSHAGNSDPRAGFRCAKSVPNGLP
jgi:formylglycine-generating enzyme required for sulfatase activity